MHKSLENQGCFNIFCDTHFFYSAGQITLASESNFGAGASANIDSNLGTTAKNPALDFIKSFNDLANIIGILPAPSSWGLTRSFKYISYYIFHIIFNMNRKIKDFSFRLPYFFHFGFPLV